MWVIRFLRTLSLYSLIMASVVLFVLSYLNPRLFDKVRFFLWDITAPAVVVFDTLMASVYTLQSKVHNIFYVYDMNQQLLAKQVDYDEKSVQLALLQQQVKQLHSVLDYNSQFGSPDGFMAKIVGRFGGVYDHSFILDKGAVDGVSIGQVMVFDGYMVGYVIDVFNTISRAIPLTNINASVPVMDMDGDKHGLILGDGPKLPKFIYADAITDFQKQDILYTSGIGGTFPRGLPIGSIQAIYNHSNVRVLPFVYNRHMTFVYIFHHKPELILQAQ